MCEKRKMQTSKLLDNNADKKTYLTFELFFSFLDGGVSMLLELLLLRISAKALAEV